MRDYKKLLRKYQQAITNYKRVRHEVYISDSTMIAYRKMEAARKKLDSYRGRNA